MNGLTFERINKYQIKISSTDHYVILTDLIKKYSNALMRAKINAGVSISVTIFSVILIIHILSNINPDYLFAEYMIILCIICVIIASLAIFTSSTENIFRFKEMIDRYESN